LSLDQVVEALGAARAPEHVATRIVAIDGLGGAGKSSLAAYLARQLGASIVHTDDFASWENALDWGPALVALLLDPLAHGRPARYTPTSWEGAPADELVVEPGGLVLLEGVSSSRKAFRPYLAYSIWIETPRGVRLRRGLERDGEQARGAWERWMADEDAYVDRERPLERASLVLPGDQDLWP
jgi:uridine kinase